MFTIRKRSKEMAIGHRLINYTGLCKNVHGHGIYITLELQSKQDPQTGLTVDFHEVNTFLSELDSFWDHGFLVNHEDKEMLDFLIYTISKHFVTNGNPTMENLCREVMNLAVRMQVSFLRSIKAVEIAEKGGNDNIARYEII